MSATKTSPGTLSGPNEAASPLAAALFPSLSSFGGEGQGEEVVVLCQHARSVGAAARWNVATNRSLENGEGPPLPNPLLQRRRGRSSRRLVAVSRGALMRNSA